jgi:hypothetical protein
VSAVERLRGSALLGRRLLTRATVGSRTTAWGWVWVTKARRRETFHVGALNHPSSAEPDCFRPHAHDGEVVLIQTAFGDRPP